jgi:hypothetical protein
MPNLSSESIDCVLFDTETEVLEKLNQLLIGKTPLVALIPVGPYQIDMYCPNYFPGNYFYKALIINNYDVIAVCCTYRNEPIPKDMSAEFKKYVIKSLGEFFKFAIRNYDRAVHNNSSLYTDDDDDDEERKIVQPEPLLFSHNRSPSPIPRPAMTQEQELMIELGNSPFC